MTVFQVGAALQLFGAAIVAMAALAWAPAAGDPLWEIPPGWMPAATYLYGPAPDRVVPGWSDPMGADYSAGGIGSAVDIAALAENPDLISDKARRAALDAWVNAPIWWAQLDTSGIDAAMARLLEPLSGVDQARLALDAWRTETPTGEIPRIREMAGANA